ncbi:MAG: type 1 glutamine amidotransferase [Candidatus Omnitrophota bacterium]|nr:type 1 glutamine amidotransferase [Candidatus Omnitrophota bacterium]
MILIIKHIDIEGPGTLGEFLKNRHIKHQVINIANGIKLPKSLRGIKAIITLGGPMNVYEVDKYPFLKIEGDFLKKALDKEIPVLGICLGAQLLAKTLGARVKKSPVKEIGWSEVSLTKQALKDNLFTGLKPQIDVFQWHEDMFELPNGGVLLAKSNVCLHQAFRFGKNSYGLQFHMEIDKFLIDSWTVRYNRRPYRIDYLFDFFKKRRILEEQSKTLYKNFLSLIKQK